MDPFSLQIFVLREDCIQAGNSNQKVKTSGKLDWFRQHFLHDGTSWVGETRGGTVAEKLGARPMHFVLNCGCAEASAAAQTEQKLKR